MTNTNTTPTSPEVIGNNTWGDVLNELDRPKVAWQPEPGAKIAGKVTSITTATSEYGSYPLVTLDPGPTEPLVDVHCFHSWLKGDIVRMEVRLGDVLGIKFLDKDGPRGAARYRVNVRHTGSGEAYKPSAEAMKPTDAVGDQYEEPF